MKAPKCCRKLRILPEIARESQQKRPKKRENRPDGKRLS
jgi:hypothetical protein